MTLLHSSSTPPAASQDWSGAQTADASRPGLTNLPFSSEPGWDSLNRALVAGVMLEVMLENPRLAAEPDSRRPHLKACLKSALASHLAGHMSLASFHSLAQGLDHWFEEIYPLLANAALPGSHRRAEAARVSGPEVSPLREDLFCECLEKTPGLLPHRRHRKLDPDKLRNFLEGTGGNWFRLRDFEGHFLVDRKTAWEYVQKLLQAGLLVHNQGHSSAVRYRIAPRFLKGAPAAAGDSGRASAGPNLQPDWHRRFPS